MACQTYSGPLQWVVVDDVIPVTRMTMDQSFVRPRPEWRGQHTLARNLREGLRLVQNDLVLIIEDDDWYSPEYFADAIPDELDLQDVERDLSEREDLGKSWLPELRDNRDYDDDYGD